MFDFPAEKTIARPRSALAVLTALLLLTSFPSSASADWQRQQRDIMGTRISVELWHAEQGVADGCSARVFAEMDRINLLMSSYLKDSELSFINDNAAIEKVTISAELSHLIRQSIQHLVGTLNLHHGCRCEDFSAELIECVS